MTSPRTGCQGNNCSGMHSTIGAKAGLSGLESPRLVPKGDTISTSFPILIHRRRFSLDTRDVIQNMPKTTLARREGQGSNS